MTQTERYIKQLLIIPGWREEKRLVKYRQFAYLDSNVRILIGRAGAIRKCHKNKTSESVSIGSACAPVYPTPDRLWRHM